MTCLLYLEDADGVQAEGLAPLAFFHLSGVIAGAQHLETRLSNTANYIRLFRHVQRMKTQNDHTRGCLWKQGEVTLVRQPYLASMHQYRNIQSSTLAKQRAAQRRYFLCTRHTGIRVRLAVCHDPRRFTGSCWHPSQELSRYFGTQHHRRKILAEAAQHLHGASSGAGGW